MMKDYRMLACLCLQVLVDGDVLVAMVADVDDDDVAPARADGRPGQLPVHGQDAPLPAQPPDDNLLYLPSKKTVRPPLLLARDRDRQLIVRVFLNRKSSRLYS